MYLEAVSILVDPFKECHLLVQCRLAIKETTIWFKNIKSKWKAKEKVLTTHK
jgi:hypothetical protein